MTHPFDAALALSREGPTRFTATMHHAWFQGTGVYGGLTAALLLKAMTLVVDDERRRSRTLHVHFAAPVTEGVVVIDVEIMRVGALVTQMSAKMTRDDDVVAFGSATFAAGRASPIVYDDTPIRSVQAFADVDEVLLGPPVAPVFTEQFSFRFVGGGLPFSGHDEAYVSTYIGPRIPRRLDASLAVALLDALPPAVLVVADTVRGGASVDFRVEFLPAFFDPALHRDGPFRVDAWSRSADDGYADETDTLVVDERVVARAHQLYAVFPPR